MLSTLYYFVLKGKLITARKQSLGQGNIFAPVCHSVYRGGGIPPCIADGIPVCLAAGLGGGGGWYLSMPCRFPGPYPGRGGEFRGIFLGGGVSRPTPKGEVEGDLARGGLQARTQGGLLLGGACSGGDACSWGEYLVETPPGRLLLRTVRILLECILV